MRLKKQQSGSALLLSLMTLALVSGITASLLVTVQEELSITKKIQLTSLIQQQLLGGEAWAEYWLLNDNPSNNTPLSSSRLLVHEVFATDYGELEINIIDLQTCININLLANATQREITRQRLQALSTSIGVDTGWIDVVTDWVDEGQSITPDQGREDAYYLAKENGYRTGDTPILADTEWRLLDIPQASIQSLAPYVCALPDTSTAININRAPKTILKAYLPNFTAQQMDALTNKIALGGFKDINDFFSQANFQSYSLMKSDWQMNTQFVSVSIKLTMQERSYWLHSQLSKDNEQKIIPYYRSFAPIETLFKMNHRI